MVYEFSAQTELEAANAAYNAIVQQIEQLNVQIDQKTQEKVAKQLQLDDITDQLTSLPVCP